MSRRRRTIYTLICAVLLVLIGISAWNAGSILLEYRTGTQTYEQMAQLFRSPAETGAAENQTGSARNFAALREVNPDVVAWISIPGTGIDYPVVQGTDNRYYLTHLVTGKRNSSGSIFLDFQAAPDFSDPYSILYGHNMLNGSMFSDLMEYKNQDFFDAHPHGVLETPTKTWQIHFFAGFVADMEDAVWDTGLAETSFSSWKEQMLAQSCVHSDRSLSADSPVIALATCSYEYDNVRFVLLGELQ